MPRLVKLLSSALLVAAGAAVVVAQAPPGPAGPQMVELVGSWTMVNDEERLIRIDPGPELGNFTGPDHEQEDDITLVSLHRSPSAWHQDPRHQDTQHQDTQHQDSRHQDTRFQEQTR